MGRTIKAMLEVTYEAALVVSGAQAMIFIKAASKREAASKDSAHCMINSVRIIHKEFAV